MLEILGINAWYWVIGILLVNILLMREILSYRPQPKLKSIFNAPPLFRIAFVFCIFGLVGAISNTLALGLELQGMKFEPKEWSGFFLLHFITYSVFTVSSFIVLQVARYKSKNQVQKPPGLPG